MTQAGEMPHPEPSKDDDVIQVYQAFKISHKNPDKASCIRKPCYLFLGQGSASSLQIGGARVSSTKGLTSPKTGVDFPNGEATPD